MNYEQLNYLWRAFSDSFQKGLVVVSKLYKEKAMLIVCSPSGRTYRLRRHLEAEIVFDGTIPIIKIE